MDSIRARWKCAQSVDLIQDFLELVENLPKNEKSESYEPHIIKLEQAYKTALRFPFFFKAVFGSTNQY